MRVFIVLLLSTYVSFGCSSNNQKVQSWAFPYFTKVDELNPILTPDKSQEFVDPITHSVAYWEERNVLNPTAVVRDNKVYMLYRAQDQSGTSRIGMAVSSDGLRFEKMPNPVFYPEDDEVEERFNKEYKINMRKRIVAKGKQSTKTENVV